MKFRVRAIGPDEAAEFLRPGSHDFGFEVTGEEEEDFKTQAEFDRTLAAFDGSQLVGTAAAISFQLTLPGETTAAAAGVTLVSVIPTHRRQGILTTFMRQQLYDVKEREEPLAILYASESVIYSRFGYGVCTTQVQWEIDRRYGAFTRPHHHEGHLSIVGGDEATTLLPNIYERARRVYPGAVNRTDAWWRRWLRDPVTWRNGASRRFYVVYASPAGEPDGYAAYRIKESWPEGTPANALVVVELMPATPQAYAALWEYCLNLDLMGLIQVENRPPDEPVRWMLADARRLRAARYGDGLWARLVDIPAALGARRYGMEGSVIFEVTDSFMPENAGRYELQGGPDGATCRRTGKSHDLALDVTDLGAAYLGNVSLSVLGRAGRVEEKTPGVLARADALFSSEPAPWCATHF